MIKVVIVTHSLKRGGGQDRVNYEIAQEVLRRGYRLIMIASKVAPELYQHPLAEWIHVSVQGWPTALLRNLVFAWHSAHWLYRHRREFDVSVVNGFITWEYSDINVVHFVHNAWLKSPVYHRVFKNNLYGLYQKSYTFLNASLEKISFNKSRVIVAVSRQVCKELLNIGIARERIRLIYNGIDLKEFFSANADREKLGLPEDVTLALFVGEIRTPRKNLDTVLHALVEVPNLQLAVVGDTKRSPYPKLAVQLGLENRVHFLGYRKDVADIMRAVDLFVFPSRYEACTLVLLEAMASGLAVVTAKTTGGSEIITPQCGIVLDDPNDIEGLVKALQTLVVNPDLRKQMGQAARAIVEQHSWTNKAKEYVDLFEETYRNKVNK